MFEEWKRGSYVKLKRNPDYWQAGLPHLDGFVTRFVGYAASASIALETGEADYTPDIALSDIERLRPESVGCGRCLYRCYLNNAQVFEFNLENPVLAKRDVRHALAHAIDRKFIIDAIFYGTAKAAASNIPSVFTAYNDMRLSPMPLIWPRQMRCWMRLAPEGCYTAPALRCG